MPISLKAFTNIANGTHNVGEIRLNTAGTGLEKVNNHVTRISQNNVRLTAEQNRRVRNALVEAFRQSGFRNTPAMDEIKQQLLGEGRDCCSLSRDYVRHLIAAANIKDIDRQMERLRDVRAIGLRLLERSISTIGETTPGGERIVKSDSEVAYGLTVNEALDKSVLKSRMALAPWALAPSAADYQENDIPRNGDPKGSIRIRFIKMAKALDTAMDGIAGLLNAEPTVRPDSGETIISRLRADMLVQIGKLAGKDNAMQKFLAYFERQMRLAYIDAGVGAPGDTRIVDEHIKRIFPDCQVIEFRSSSLMLGRNEITDEVFTLYGEDPDQRKAMLGPALKQEADNRMATVKEGLRRIGQGLVNDLEELMSIRVNCLMLVRDIVLNSRAACLMKNPGIKLAICKSIGLVIQKREQRNPRMARGNLFWNKIRQVDLDDGPGLATLMERQLRADVNAIFRPAPDIITLPDARIPALPVDYEALRSESAEILNRLGLGV